MARVRGRCSWPASMTLALALDRLRSARWAATMAVRPAMLKAFAPPGGMWVINTP